MKESRCSVCNTEILEHEAISCLNEWLARDIFHIVPCSLWRLGNFGSAGGPVLQKECKHERDSCYPLQVISTMFGEIGGCPQYGTSYAFVKSLMSKIWKMDELATIDRLGISVSVCEDTYNFWHIEGETFPLQLCRAVLFLSNNKS